MPTISAVATTGWSTRMDFDADRSRGVDLTSINELIFREYQEPSEVGGRAAAVIFCFCRQFCIVMLQQALACERAGTQ